MKTLIFLLTLLPLSPTFASDTSWETALVSEFREVDICLADDGLVMHLMQDWRKSGKSLVLTFNQNSKKIEDALVRKINTDNEGGACISVSSLVGSKSSDGTSLSVTATSVR